MKLYNSTKENLTIRKVPKDWLFLTFLTANKPKV